MESPNGTEGSRQIPWSRSLSLLEHKLFGSTPYGKVITPRDINILIGKASRGKDEKAVDDLLKPPVLSEGVSREVIDKARMEKRKTGSIILLGEKAFDENSPLNDYDLSIVLGSLDEQGLTEGFDIEVVANSGNPDKFLSEEKTSLILDQMIEEGKRPKNTIRQLVEVGKIKVSFSEGDTGTVMHFRYNFGLEREKRPDAAFLSPLEYKMMGSSPVIGDDMLDVNSLLLQAAEGNEKALQTLLSPQVILEKDEFLGNVDKVNRKRKAIKLKTPMLLADEWKTRLSLEYGLEVGLEPRGVDSKGLIIPEWTMRLVNGNGSPVKNHKVLSELKFIDSGVGKYLELKPAEPDSDTRTLVLKLPSLTPTPTSNAV